MNAFIFNGLFFGGRRNPVAALTVAVLAIIVAACSNETNGQEPSTDQVPKQATVEVEQAEEPEEYPSVDEILPEPMATLWQPWHGDLDGIIERRVIRVLVPFGGYQYYFVRGRPKGAIVELLQKMEKHLNDELGRKHIHRGKTTPTEGSAGSSQR